MTLSSRRGVAKVGLSIFLSLGICGAAAILLGITTWQAALYIFAGVVFVFLLGGVMGLLLEVFSTTSKFVTRFLVVWTIILSISGAFLMQLEWYFPNRPAMSEFELDFSRMVLGIDLFVGAYVFKNGRILQQRVKELESDSDKNLPARLSMSNTLSVFLIVGGIFILVVSWGLYFGPGAADPFLMPSLLSGGIGCLLLGSYGLLIERYPRLADFVGYIGAACVLLLIYFGVRVVLFS